MKSLRKPPHIHIVDTKNPESNPSPPLAIVGSCVAATIKSESWVSAETIAICGTPQEAFDGFVNSPTQIFICDMYPEDPKGWTGVRAAEKVRQFCQENNIEQPSIYLLTKDEPNSIEIAWAKNRANVENVLKRSASALHQVLATIGHPQENQFVTRRKLLDEAKSVDEIFKRCGVGPVATTIINGAKRALTSGDIGANIESYIDYLARKIVSDAKRSNFIQNCSDEISKKRSPLKN